MTGIFGNLFDINDDGKLDCVEQAADYLAFERTMNAEDEGTDLDTDNDFDDCDDDI